MDFLKSVKGMKQAKLVCPCGLPLTLYFAPDWNGKPTWLLGHFEAMCSPIIHGESLEAVMEAFMEEHSQPLKEAG